MLPMCRRMLLAIAVTIGMLGSGGLWPMSLATAADRVVRVGIYQNSPKVFTDESGQSAGIFVDVLEEIARQEGWKLRYVAGSWSEGLQRLEEGQIDLMPDVAFNSERARVFGFHRVPVLASWFQVYVRPESGIKTVLDLKGRRIAVLKDSVQESAFRHLTDSFGVETSLLAAPDYQAVFQSVVAGEADAAIVNHFYGARHAAEMGLEDTAIIFSPSDLFFATRLGFNQELLEAIDKHLQSMKQEQGSAYYHSLSRWISDDTDAEVPAWLRVGAQVLGLLLVLSLVGAFLLRHQVQVKTRHLQRMNRALATLSAASVQAARAESEGELLERVCRVIVDTGGYELAWVAFRNETLGVERLQVAALAVRRGANRERLEGCWCDGGWGMVQAEASLQRSLPVVYGNLTEEGALAGSRAEIEQSGLLAALSIPIGSQGSTYGVLSVLSTTAKAFLREEVALFTDLANDLAVGIAGLRAKRQKLESEAQREAAEAALRENERTLTQSLRDHAQELELRVAQRTAELAVSRDKAEESDRLKSAFLATMSHELRTPLNSIIGFSGILLQELAGPLNDEQKKQMGMVCSSSEHLLALINDVLDLSKIEAGELQLFPEDFDLEASIVRLVAVTQPLARRKGLDLDVQVGPGLSYVVGDRRRVEQVLLNLLSNGIKFTETGSVRVQAECRGDSCVVEVIDSGIGIKESDLCTLFRPFRQVDSGLARKHEGTGLGLSICKRLVELMGGRIGARSEWGVGSTFFVELPMRGGRLES